MTAPRNGTLCFAYEPPCREIPKTHFSESPHSTSTTLYASRRHEVLTQDVAHNCPCNVQAAMLDILLHHPREAAASRCLVDIMHVATLMRHALGACAHAHAPQVSRILPSRLCRCWQALANTPERGGSPAPLFARAPRSFGAAPSCQPQQNIDVGATAASWPSAFASGTVLVSGVGAGSCRRRFGASRTCATPWGHADGCVQACMWRKPQPILRPTHNNMPKPRCGLKRKKRS